MGVGALSVVVADGQGLFAEALATGLDLQPDVEVLHHEARTGLEAIDAFASLAPDVLVLDYWLGEMNGPAAAAQVLAADPTARVVIVGWLCGGRQVSQARVSGAAGFVPKSVTLEEFVTVLKAVKDGFSVFPGNISGAQLEWSRPETPVRGASRFGLSVREIEVLQLFCDGSPRSEVAAKLGIREGTVKNHMHNILTKMGSRTMLEAVSQARSSRLVRETGPGPPTPDGLG